MREKELRIALVCFGGVSLAVYMHGISYEILKLVRASSALHRIADRARRAQSSFFDQAERAEGLRMVGIVLGVLGVGLLLGVDLSGSGDELLGGFAVLLAGLGYAIGGLLAKHKLADHPPIGVAAWVLTAGAVLLVPAAVIGFPTSAPSLGPVAAVVTLGVVGTGIAFAIFYELIATVGPARTFIVTYLAPAFAVVYGVTLLDEEVTVATLGGLALILAGSYLAAEGRNPLRRRRAVASVPDAGAA